MSHNVQESEVTSYKKIDYMYICFRCIICLYFEVGSILEFFDCMLGTVEQTLQSV